MLRDVLERQQILKQQLSIENKELTFFDNFIKNNKILNEKKLDEIELDSLLIAYIKATYPEYFTLEELKKALEPINYMIETATKDQMAELLAGIRNLCKKCEFNELESILTEKNRFVKEKEVKNIIPEEIEAEVISNLVTEVNDMFLSFVRLYYKNPDAIDEGISTIYCIKESIEERAEIKEVVDEFTSNLPGKLQKKVKEKLLEKSIKREAVHSVSEIQENLKPIITYDYKLKNQEKEKRRNLNKELRGYDTLRQLFLQKNASTIIANPKTIISQITDENLQLEILKLIYQQNLEIHKQTEQTYNTLAENTATRYQALLEEYGISKDQYNDEDVMIHSLQETKEILTALGNLKISNQEAILSLLQVTNKEYLQEVLELEKEGYISKNFLQENLALMNTKTNLPQIIKEKKDLLSDKSINPKLLSNDEKNWLIEKETFKKNLDILENNSLLTSLGKTTSLDFLSNKDLNPIVDMILELGYESLLEKNLDLLNYTQEQLMRIQILKDLNIVITEEADLKEVLESKTFIVPEDKIADYVVEPEEMTQDHLLTEAELQGIENKLRTVYQTKRTYNLDGVYLSKERIRRNIEQASKYPTTATPTTILLKGATLTQQEEKQAKQVMKEKQIVLK